MLITDQQQWEEKLKSFGREKAQIAVICDFDFTLTPFHDADGNIATTSVGSIRKIGSLGVAYGREAQQLYETYIAHDRNPLLSVEEKTDLMVEWYTKHFTLMFASGLCQETIAETCAKGLFSLREGAQELIRYCGLTNIPFVVMSAGLGDVIAQCLRSYDLEAAVHIVGNRFLYDDAGRAYELDRHMIHPYNKFVVSLKDFVPPFAEKTPTHCIVVGDHIGDSRMAESFPQAEVLRVGILDEAHMNLLPEYQKHFDLVLFGNTGLDTVAEFLQEARRQ